MRSVSSTPTLAGEISSTRPASNQFASPTSNAAQKSPDEHATAADWVLVNTPSTVKRRTASSTSTVHASAVSYRTNSPPAEARFPGSSLIYILAFRHLHAQLLLLFLDHHHSPLCDPLLRRKQAPSAPFSDQCLRRLQHPGIPSHRTPRPPPAPLRRNTSPQLCSASPRSARETRDRSTRACESSMRSSRCSFERVRRALATKIEVESDSEMGHDDSEYDSNLADD
ncbi:hypothetical protein MRB53_039423 [Persea americana]|nr:hypothetical protein MRB53_039423 [Persea americana]